MFGYKRSYAGKRRGFYSFGRYYGKYSRRGTIGRAASGAAAAKRSDKTETYSCTVNGLFSVNLEAYQNLSNVTAIAPYHGGIRASGVVDDDRNIVHGGAINDRGFRMKCACYDEVKLDTMKVTIIPAQVQTNNFVTTTVCTSWDRKASPREAGYRGNEAWMANGAPPTALEIFNNEGTIKSNFTNNVIYGVKRYCRASSIIEKGGYCDSSIYYNPTPGQSPTSWMYLDAWLRSPIAFSPCLYITVYSAAAFTAARVLNFSYKVEYSFTFRNPKSDLDYFLLVENPEFVNPAGRDAVGDEDPRSAKSRAAARLKEGGTLLSDLQKNYALTAIKTMDSTTAAKTIDDIFVKPEVKKAKEEQQTVMDVEDDPGTS